MPFQVSFNMYFLDACGHCQEIGGWLVLSMKQIGMWLWLEEVQGAD